MPDQLFSVRQAQPTDAAAIVALLQPYVCEGLILPRRREEIEARSQDFFIAEIDSAIVGCVALRDFGAGLIEIRSLAVAESCAGHGIGSCLVRTAVAAAGDRGNTRIFALTKRPHLFERLGFVVVDKHQFPQKVWADCHNCRKLDCCDEVAMSLQS